MQKNSKLPPVLFSMLFVYFFSYAYARIFIFHRVEAYAGIEGKGGPRQDHIAKKGYPPGEGWEYQLFLPAIRAEESISNYFRNL